MLPNRYDFHEVEPRLVRLWSATDPYAFDAYGSGPIYTIDTPPPTVSGTLHIGHCYSYSQTDVIARFHRMRGERVLYPMGFDDNGLPTERFVEKTIGKKATQMERAEFLAQCLELIQQTEDGFRALWRRMSLSVDWRYTYSTISPQVQRTSQWSFIQLYQAGRAYTQQAPTLWCPECQTAIAQAEQDDKVLPTLFSTLAFHLQDGTILPIATTRPELLPACVAIFVHPADDRYRHLIGAEASIASSAFSQKPFIEVPILADELVDPTKGSGAVMCCTFGDSTDVRWWRTHDLPLLKAIGRAGRMTSLAGPYEGFSTVQARQRILAHLMEQDLILSQETIEHNVGVHERCGTPVEYIHTRQWFIRILDQKERFLGHQIHWNPEYMRQRYEHWVENLQWDWCISRQRFLGVPFPAWTCRACGEIYLASLAQLPVDPRVSTPQEACTCGASDFEPELDVMDTWATSSCSPLFIGRWPDDPVWFAQHFPASLRPQAHDIIRTWTFYTIVKSLYHTNELPWREIAISGHGLSAEKSKLSKSKQHNEIGPGELIERESADALRYWATSAKPGSDSPLKLEVLSNGRRLVTKLWSASRFAEVHLQGLPRQFLSSEALPVDLLPTDRWLLSRLARTIAMATTELEHGNYSTARAEVERFFWSDLCDNYLELAKARLYQEHSRQREAAQWTLYQALLNVLKMLAPYLPFVTEEIYLSLFQRWEETSSIHVAAWPELYSEWVDPQAEAIGGDLLEILRLVRRYKADHGLSVGSELNSLRVTHSRPLHSALATATIDLKSATRARTILFVSLDAPIQGERTDVQSDAIVHLGVC